jgi:hypothetical protein
MTFQNTTSTSISGTTFQLMTIKHISPPSCHGVSTFSWNYTLVFHVCFPGRNNALVHWLGTKRKIGCPTCLPQHTDSQTLSHN